MRFQTRHGQLDLLRSRRCTGNPFIHVMVERDLAGPATSTAPRGSFLPLEESRQKAFRARR